MEKPFPWLERLSSSIVDLVKELEARGEQITKENVTRMLSQNPSLVNIDFIGSSQDTTVRSSHIKIVRELEEEQEKIVELFRSTISAISPFINFGNVDVLSKKFEEFKKKLQDDVSTDQLEEALIAFKETVIQYEIRPEESKKGFRKFLGLFHKNEQDLMKELKPMISEFIGAIDSSVPEFQKEKWSLIRETFWKINTVQDLMSWNATFAEFLRNMLSQINQEHRALDEFISELGQNLIEIEKNVIASLEHVHSSQEISNKLNYHIDGQVNDLRQSVRTMSNLEELRRVLLNKLSYIRQVLENKRKHEEEYNKELEERIQILQRELNVINDQIKQVQSREKKLAEEILKDPLTGIANRRAYEIRIAEEWERFQRYGHVFSIAIFDIDHFKGINDSYGHKAGDMILKELARLMKTSLRKSDFIARYGGEEFVVIFTGTNIQGAREAAEKLRQVIEKTRFVLRKQEVPVTISAGVSQVKPDDKSLIDTFERADKALYVSKNSGRNKVTVSP